MPVVLPHDDKDGWLEASAAERRELCQPYSTDDIDAVYTVQDHRGELGGMDRTLGSLSPNGNNGYYNRVKLCYTRS